MTSILQLRAQFESLANQYADNEDEAASCAARRDEGKSGLDTDQLLSFQVVHLLLKFLRQSICSYSSLCCILFPGSIFAELFVAPFNGLCSLQ